MRFAQARASGVLLHPTSLPGALGIGDLGKPARMFLDFLHSAGQTLWQVLPIGPTGYGDSPYACFSSFAGNPLLISLENLVEGGILSPADLAGPPPFPSGRVEYGRLMEWKLPLLRRAALRFLENANDAERKRFETFRSEEVRWLDDYALFIALKDFFDRSARERGRQCGAWNESWDRDIALRGEEAMVFWKKRLEAEISVNQAIQFFFFTQWRELRAAARERGIRIIGDMPIFAAPDSADVWANRGLFLLDGDGRPTAVSGVPPDYFASTGQLWGNPLYDWGALRRQGFRFWIDRIGAAGRLFDFIRMDHFRGFSSCWAIPAGDPTAESGTWVASPGAELFEALERELGQLPLIAEDLGVITPEVNALRERFGFPGMRILQFAFDRAEAGALNADNRFLPHNHRPDSVVYTGTHDNDTTVGWYARRTREERLFLDAYAPSGEPDVAWRFIRMALASVSPFAIIPLQDILGLGSEARMNAPGTTGEQNWTWRFEANALDESIAHRLRSLSALYGRIS